MKYTCVFCKQSYQSDGTRKPKSFRKDGSVYQHYDSKLFCSKECCTKNSREKYKNTIKNNPEVMKQAGEKKKKNYQNNPEIRKNQSEKMKNNYQNNPDLKIRISNSIKTTFKNNPEIMKNRSILFQDHPEIMKKSVEKRKITLKNNPEIMKRIIEKRKITYQNNPGIIEKRIRDYKNTIKNNPGIIERIKNSLKTTLKNNPEILRNASIKRKTTLKNKFKIKHSNSEILLDYNKLINFVKEKNIKSYTELAHLFNYSNCSCITQYLENNNLKTQELDKLLNNSISSYEKEITNFLDQLDIKYELHNREILEGKEIDIYIPEYKIGIEFNSSFCHGEYFYYNNSLNTGKDKYYHQSKSIQAEQKGIFLFHIFEYQWVKKDILFSMLKNLLNHNNYTIGARKTKIRELNKKECDLFLEANHLQGKDNSSIRYGLYYNNLLVSVMTFVKPRFNHHYDYELSRFCSLKDYNIIGAASKLFNYFLKKYPNKSIISYSNNSVTKGNLYSKLGFQYQSLSSPNYIWFKYKDTEENKDLKDIYKRYEVQKHRIEEFKGDTETEKMMNLGYYRIFDCGNKVWII